jgi:hypothetical protein
MNESNAKILRKVGNTEAFYFSRAFDAFTGQKANSLEEFKQKIMEVDVKCLEFHLSRKDLEKWIKLTIGDFQLSGDLRTLREQKLIGETLRNRLSLLVSKRLKELTNSSNLSESKRQTKKKRSSWYERRIGENQSEDQMPN